MLFRGDNVVLFSLIYFTAGLFWLYRGTLKEFAANLARLAGRKQRYFAIFQPSLVLTSRASSVSVSSTA